MSIQGFKTKTQNVYEKLYEDIIDGGYDPGSKIVICAVAEKFGVSEIPVREALKKLEAEGLVENKPHIGFLITKPDFNTKKEIFHVRNLLEGEAVALAATKMTDETLAKLIAINAKMKECQFSEISKIVKLNNKFHDLLYSSCGNHFLFKTIQQIRSMVPRTKSIFVFFKDRVKTSTKEHEEICQFIAARDPEGAKRALFSHKQKSYDMLLQMSSASPENAEEGEMGHGAHREVL